MFDIKLDDVVNISCLFENGFPKPDFDWTDESGIKIASSQVEYKVVSNRFYFKDKHNSGSNTFQFGNSSL